MFSEHFRSLRERELRPRVDASDSWSWSEVHRLSAWIVLGPLIPPVRRRIRVILYIFVFFRSHDEEGGSGRKMETEYATGTGGGGEIGVNPPVFMQQGSGAE